MRFPFSFKIGLVTSIIAVCATSISVLLIYNRTYDMTIELMNNRLTDIGKVSSFLFKKEEIKIIKELAGAVQDDAIPYADKLKDIKSGETLLSLSRSTANHYMKSEEFQHLVKRLRELKSVSVMSLKKGESAQRENSKDKTSQLIEYAYILVTIPEAPDKSVLKFLVDADYAASGVEEGNPIGNLYRIKQQSFRNAFNGTASAENHFIEDRWGTWLTAAVPIYDYQEKVIAIIGLDLNVSSEANKVKLLFYICLSAIVISLIVSLGASVILSKLLTRPVKKLRIGAEQVGKRDFSTYIDVKSNDELGLLADTFNSMVTEIRNYAAELEETNEVYFRFVPREFLMNLGISKIVDIKLGDHVQKEMSILFSDIRSFTTISEGMTPGENYNFLNSYLKYFVPVIRENSGFIDKYIGDAIMAIFPDKVEDPVDAAIGMRKALRRLNEHRLSRGFKPVDMGVGIHTGNLMMGTVGEEERMETTVISDAVNVASRLEGLTKKMSAPVIVSAGTFAKIEDKNKYRWRDLGKVHVKGKKFGVRIYEILDGEPDEVIDMRLATRDNFKTALGLFQKGNFGKAALYFKKVLEKDEGDRAAQVYLKRCSAG